MRFLFLLLALAIPVLAQDAIVFGLTVSEQTEAKQLYDTKTKADKAWETFQKRMTEKFGTEVEFDKTFSAAVPKKK